MVPFRDAQIPAWLDSEKDWEQRLGEGWTGTKFLGKGSFGIVGLWEYRGDPANAPEITQVVVKQCEDADQDPERNIWGGKTPYDEARILTKLSKAKTNHIIKQYGGNRVGDKFLEMGYVVRIFLEFCPGGDLKQLLAKEGEDPNTALSEADFWAIFNCLALGVFAMYCGTEDPSERGWLADPDYTEICHFDIKPDNSKGAFFLSI